MKFQIYHFVARNNKHKFIPIAQRSRTWDTNHILLLFRFLQDLQKNYWRGLEMCGVERLLAIIYKSFISYY